MKAEQSTTTRHDQNLIKWALDIEDARKEDWRKEVSEPDAIQKIEQGIIASRLGLDPVRDQAEIESAKVFRIFPEYTGGGWSGIFYDSNSNARMQEVFEEAGYVCLVGGHYNSRNPNEVSEIRYNIPDSVVAEHAGISMPQSFEPEELLTSGPVVAKLKGGSRGDGIYCLETEEQKVKFITAALLFGSNDWVLEELAEMSSVQRTAMIGELFSAVRRGDFTSDFFNPDSLDIYEFQKQVVTSSRYDLSYRVVMDWTGEMLYAQLNRSEKETGSDRVLGQAQPRFEELGITDPVIMATYLGVSVTEILLTLPESPFFINSKKIVSNISKGGERILLNGDMGKDEINREVLEACGINPESPKLPAELMRASKSISATIAGRTPLIGIDYIPSAEGNLFLEVNNGPGLCSEFLGLTPGMYPGDAQVEACRIVLQRDR